jgi:hypothetical protein
LVAASTRGDAADHPQRDFPAAFDEHAFQLRTGTGPHIMACLPNLAIGILSRAGPANLAAAVRHHSRVMIRC